jgi:hypothetical protein
MAELLTRDLERTAKILEEERRIWETERARRRFSSSFFFHQEANTESDRQRFMWRVKKTAKKEERERKARRANVGIG